MNGAPRIAPLDPRDAAVARQLHGVWSRAYTQESTLLGLKDFPPLDRSVQDLQASTDHFIGAWRGDTLLGAVALARDAESPPASAPPLAINTLIVDPAHQRQGVARLLMNAVLQQARGAALTVATGAANAPALALYAEFGFALYRRGSMGPDELPVVQLRRLPDAPAQPAVLDHAGIAERVPHHGRMCLLDRLLSWGPERIDCSATSHRDPANPLRTQGGLLAPNAIEYAAQAMALHGSLTAAPGSAPTPGFLASVRGVRLRVPRLDAIAGDLRVSATRQAGDERQALYAFAVHDDAGALLVDGRATVILNALP